MKTLDSLSKVTNEDESIDTLLELARVCLEKVAPEVAANEDLDDILDMDTIYRIIEVCGGVKLNDPNLVAAARDLALAGAAGTN